MFKQLGTCEKGFQMFIKNMMANYIREVYVCCLATRWLCCFGLVWTEIVTELFGQYVKRWQHSNQSTCRSKQFFPKVTVTLSRLTLSMCFSRVRKENAGWICGFIDGYMNGWMYSCLYECMEGWEDGWMAVCMIDVSMYVYSPRK